MQLIEITSVADLDDAIRAIERGPGGMEADAGPIESVRSVLREVAVRGDAAVAEFTERFDRVKLAPAEFEVSSDAIDAAYHSVDADLRGALERAHANILAFHQRNLRQSWEESDPDGSVIGQRISAIDRAGLYVPGGTAFYPSSVLMNIVPARVAGVRDIIMVSPPSYQGSIHPLVLCAAKIVGATRVFRIGGAQAIAALAYGTEHIPAVSKIAGPGNVYVTLAKRLVSLVCDIDKEAGPSEVVAVADESANPEFAAAELIAQAEHDEASRAILVTTSRKMYEAVLAAIESQLSDLPRAAIVRTAMATGGQGYIVRSLDDAACVVDAIAPEHLSIQTADPRAFFDRVSNVGCAVLGGGTSVAVGDYFAGPNHILPTERRARFASPLTADDFRKVTSIISYSPARMAKDGPDIMRLARAEELEGHARAVEMRL